MDEETWVDSRNHHRLPTPVQVQKQGPLVSEPQLAVELPRLLPPLSPHLVSESPIGCELGRSGGSASGALLAQLTLPRGTAE